MNFQKKSRNGNEKKYLREFDALEMLLENVTKVWNKMAEMCHQKSGKLTLIPNSSRPIPTFFYGKVFEVK